MACKMYLGSAVGLTMLALLIGNINCKDECPVLREAIKCIWQNVSQTYKSMGDAAKLKIGENLCFSLNGTTNLGSCVKDNLNFANVKECFSITEVLQVHKNIGMLKNGLEFWCKDKGAKFQKFVNNNGMDCVLEQAKTDQCNASFVTNYAHTTKDANFCTAQGKAMDCILNKTLTIDKCNNNETKAIMTEFINSVRKDSPCSAAYTFQLSAVAILVALMMHIKDFAAPESK